MKTIKFLFIAFTIVSLYNCKETVQKPSLESVESINKPNDSTIIGAWKHMSSNGPVKINFREDGFVETDLGDNNSIDIVSSYVVKFDTITFFDKEGKSCPNQGVYKVYNRGYTVAFDVIDDLCNGRIKSTIGFWVRPNHMEQISELNAIIEKSNDIDLILNRGRMYLALAKTKLAKNDFDAYIKKDSLDAKVFINRAATRFPNGLKGIVYDCTKAIELDSTEKHAYFLRGLAYYGLNEKQKGCDDFQKSIDLGFEILKEAEYNKCKEYW
ncbi:tetratricopeptide repeat protein [Lutibacter holmesii]|uniref:Tetratricopeptide repeat protein n=1 Tax=Lutibacter holmesii TaxID=1137985 RepID=A0ABW3WK57_9FLAO